MIKNPRINSATDWHWTAPTCYATDWQITDVPGIDPQRNGSARPCTAGATMCIAEAVFGKVKNSFAMAWQSRALKRDGMAKKRFVKE